MTHTIRVSTIGVLAALWCCAATATAQTPAKTAPAPSSPTADPLVTPAGTEVNFSFGHYNYVEPGDTPISIHGLKFGGELTATIPINKRSHWFAQANVRGVFGNMTYDGFCMPWLITPNSASPNGYELDLGAASPCSEDGAKDWYVETRGMVGKDLVGGAWALSPYSGVGFRYLSDGVTGTPGYRTDKYLYVPIGATVRTEIASSHWSRAASHHVLSFTVEYDLFARGWQNTYNSLLGGGTVPATPTAPAFVLNGLSDVAFDQHGGWGLRLSGRYTAGPRWYVEPFYQRWNVNDSPVRDIFATFTVNNITARETLGAYEPKNYTNEFGVKLGWRFK
jgi:hypothetical protein